MYGEKAWHRSIYLYIYQKQSAYIYIYCLTHVTFFQDMIEKAHTGSANVTTAYRTLAGPRSIVNKHYIYIVYCVTYICIHVWFSNLMHIILNGHRHIYRYLCHDLNKN